MAVVTAAVAAVAAVGVAAYSANQQGKAAKTANKLAGDANERQAQIAERQLQIAEEDRDYYKENFRPLEEQYLSEAQGLGSIANQNKDAQQAAADVASTFGGAREQLNEAPGLNPNSDAYQRQAGRIALGEAATSAAAQTGARENARAKGRAAVGDAINIGRGLPSQSASMMSSASGGIGSARDYYGRMGATADKQSAENWGAAGRIVGGLSQNKSFQNWMNSDSGAGQSPPNPWAGGGASNYDTFQSSPMANTLYSTGGLGD